ncbi:NAD(P)/FAD-dependent oxidoreductase [Piscirickettsia salmonis]|uniref:NAD(P)/FAD-dependent oxidoreductase n=1 Tax=Piscirickettsia salmonis TaxID=1238 RepID=UPI000F0752D0|nr:NAD(P)/FAD-dependent oxidoreductase [Piscirickettsiaceae bacterium NZ-RLO2]
MINFEGDDVSYCDYDVVVIGAGFSGLAATLFLANANRRILLVDSQQGTRNHHALKAYNVVGYGDKSPHQIIAETNQQLDRFSKVKRCYLQVNRIMQREGYDDFLMTLSDASSLIVKRVIFATGVTDLLPNIEGIQPFWPHNIFHCPYCIAYELRDLPLAIYSPNDEAYMMAKIIHKWTSDLTVFTEGQANFSAEQQHELDQLGIKTNTQKICTVSGEPGQFINFHLEGDKDHDVLLRRGVFIHLEFQLNNRALIDQLGLVITAEGIVSVDSSYQTSQAGVYAVGDMGHLFQKISHALHSANVAAFHIDHELAMMPYY